VEPGSINAFTAVTGGSGDGATFQWRDTADAASDSSRTLTGIAPPYYARIVREGNTFTGYLSADGENWEQQGDSSVDVAMTDPVLIGLALTSHNVNQATSAEFSEISFSGNVSASWEMAEIGAAQPTGNDVAPLYAALEDTSGNVAVVTHPDENIVGRSNWTEWLISYGDLAGVNLGRVARIMVGVGDRDNPTADGAGLIFVDDIGYGRPAPPPAPVNLLANGGFEDGVVDPWGSYGDATIEVVSELVDAAVPDGPIEGDMCLHVTVASAGANFWDAGLQHTGHVFEAGKNYTLSAYLKAKEGTMDINFKPELAADPWTGYGSQAFTMTDEWQEFSVTTGVMTEDVDPASITFHIAYAPGEFWVDDVRFVEVAP
ncbi:MAG: carbohydrate binding domain-containing protein, partial [Planctomycetota bacterium]